MKRDSMASDEARASIVKFDEDVAKIPEELDHGRDRGTKRTGWHRAHVPRWAYPRD